MANISGSGDASAVHPSCVIRRYYSFTRGERGWLGKFETEKYVKASGIRPQMASLLSRTINDIICIPITRTSIRIHSDSNARGILQGCVENNGDEGRRDEWRKKMLRAVCYSKNYLLRYFYIQYIRVGWERARWQKKRVIGGCWCTMVVQHSLRTEYNPSGLARVPKNPRHNIKPLFIPSLFLYINKNFSQHIYSISTKKRVCMGCALGSGPFACKKIYDDYFSVGDAPEPGTAVLRFLIPFYTNSSIYRSTRITATRAQFSLQNLANSTTIAPFWFSLNRHLYGFMDIQS